MVKMVENKPQTEFLKKKLNPVPKGLIESKPEVKWTSEMSVEESTIDAQHKTLIAYLNKLLKEMKGVKEVGEIRETLHFFQEYWKKHFTYEEGYMKKIGYPKLAEHKKIHQDFAKFTKNFEKKINQKLYSKINPAEPLSETLSKLHDECKKYLYLWLKNHIMQRDQDFHKYAVKKGLIESKPVSKIPQTIVKKKVVKPLAIKSSKPKLAVKQIASKVREELLQQRQPIVDAIPKGKLKSKPAGEYIQTGIQGFDELLDVGIPKGNLILVAGGAGAGKTIFCVQVLINKALEGKKCLIMTLEESEPKLIQHMEKFGWPVKDLIKKGNLKIQRINPFDITRNVDALLAKQKGELLIEVDPVILPKDFSQPDFIMIDSLTAIASAFTRKDESYRIYIEQLFRFLEKSTATGFLVTETEQIPKIFSPTGVEEFLADGVIVLYNIKHGNVRENAIELLKLRGASHQKKIVAMQITEKGIMVYPDQEVFSEI